MVTIGLTGGFKTGKSTVASMFVHLGARMIDADKIVHQLIARNGICVADIKKSFGASVIHRGRVDRKALAEIVFDDKSKLRKLEQIIHPKVRKEIKSKIREIKKKHKNSIVVVDVPLLFESGLNREVDLTVVVKASRALQIKRAMNQLGVTKIQALQRIRSQMSMAQKIRLADYVVDNTGSKQETLKKVKRIWQKIQSKLNG